MPKFCVVEQDTFKIASFCPNQPDLLMGAVIVIYLMLNSCFLFFTSIIYLIDNRIILIKLENML